MRELKSEEVKKIQINILKAVDKFCRENNIKYFLSGGTLLGAIRHKGYIPWDDDIDIMMPRSDYNKLLNLLNQKKWDFRIKSKEIDSKFPFTFAKIEDITTVLIEDTQVKYEIGINIDVFPLDGFPENEEESIRFVKKIVFLRNIYSLKIIKFNRKRKLIKNICLFLSKISLLTINMENLIGKIVNMSKKYDYNSSRYVGCVVWGYGLRERMNKDIFESSIEVEFENNLYKAPIGYELYLKHLYGDFMKLPPEEKRNTHHRYYAYSKKDKL